jgi:hypothetical protein
MRSPVSSLAFLLLSIASTGHVAAFAFHGQDVRRPGFTNLATHHSCEPSTSERKHELSHLAVAAAFAVTMAVNPFPAFADGAYGKGLRRLSCGMIQCLRLTPPFTLGRFNQRVQVPSH